ncbi:DUF5672 family protein [Novosphingobium bradum]|uniref:DUF5672 family protein n=1 Tax=Novosphingobium bradum TaxID=1737444 RepID=A0ABV7IMS9_9SPHN
MPAPVLTPSSTGVALPQVTLAAITSIAPEATARAVALSMAGIAFGEVLWISDLAPPPSLAGRVRWEPIAPLTSRDAYSRFMLRDLAGLVGTDHVLCVQWDGHVIDPARWDPAFLDFDYIGAVWPQFRDGAVVGNGGFSLRSRRLLQACAALPGCGPEAEDVFICRTMRSRLERDHAIRFAPPELAARFAYERERGTAPAFGFHGVFNLVELVSDREAAGLVAQLPMRSLARNELREIGWWALRHGRLRLAAEVARRWRRWL